MSKVEQGKLQNKFDHAIRHHSAGRLQKARQLYHKVLKLDPEHNDTLHMLGLLTHQLGDNNAAIRLLNRALQQGAESAELFTNLGNALQASGQNKEAITSFKKALKINPDYILAHNNLGNALNLAGNKEAAVKSFNTAIRLDPNAALAYYNLGNLFYSKGEQENAIAHFRKALAIQPEFADANNNLASLLAATGNIKEAIELFKNALKLNKNNAMAQHMLNALQGNTSTHPSPDYVINLFDSAANDFDRQLVGKLDYKAPQLIYQAVQETSNSHDNDLDIMDLGCGTGLCAPLFHASAKTLKGIDLSQEMLVKAKALNLYNELIKGDITTQLQRLNDKYDLILSADVFIYVGDLKSIFKICAQSLKPNSLFTFSLEAEESGTDFRLCNTGRYAHSMNYIRKLAKENALEERYFAEATLRMDNDKPIKGYIVVLGN